MTTLEMPAETLTGDSYADSNPPTLAEQSAENPIADEAAAMVEEGGEDEGLNIEGVICMNCEGTGTVEISNLPGEHGNREQEACSQCDGTGMEVNQPEAAEVPPGGGNENPCDGSTSPHEPPPLQHGMATVEDDPGGFYDADETAVLSRSRHRAAESIAQRAYGETLREAENAYVELSLIRAKIQSDLKAAKEVEKEALERVQDIHDKGWQSFMRKEESGSAAGNVAAAEISQGGESIAVPGDVAALADPESTLAAVVAADWRLVSIDELGLKGKFIDKLKDADAGTMGGLEDLRARAAANPLADVWPQGVGPKKIEAITNAHIEWMAKHAHGMDEVDSTTATMEASSPTLAEQIAAGDLIPPGDDLIALENQLDEATADVAAELAPDDAEEAARIGQILKRAGEIEWEFPADGSGPKPINVTAKKFKGHFEDGATAFQNDSTMKDCNWIGPSEEQDAWLRGYIWQSRNVAAEEEKPAEEKPETAETTMEVGEVNVEDL